MRIALQRNPTLPVQRRVLSERLWRSITWLHLTLAKVGCSSCVHGSFSQPLTTVEEEDGPHTDEHQDKGNGENNHAAVVTCKVEPNENIDQTQADGGRAEDSMTLHDLGRRARLFVDAVAGKTHGPGGDDQSGDNEANDLMAGVEAGCLVELVLMGQYFLSCACLQGSASC